MTTDPIRFLDDPSIDAELREVMLGQAKPDALPAGQRDVVERRIAASVLALPISLKLGGLVSHGTASAGTAASGSGAMASSGAATAASVQAGGAAASGVAVASTSVAPAAAGSVLAGSGITLAGAKGAIASVAGAVSMTKGAAVLGMALATGAGATYVTQELAPARDAGAARSEESTRDEGAGRSDSARAGISSAGRSRGRARPGERSVRVGVADDGMAKAGAREPAGEDSGLHSGVSLSELEDVRHASSEAPAALRPTWAVAPGAVPASPEVVPPDQAHSSEQLQEEVALLRRAQQLLRVDRGLAAQVLDRYDAKFPQGAMRAEYEVLRRRAEQSLGH